MGTEVKSGVQIYKYLFIIFLAGRNCEARDQFWALNYASMPQRLLEFSPVPIMQAITLVYSIKVHAPVFGLTVSTVVVPCSLVAPRHCGVSPNSSIMVLNTRSVSSHTTGFLSTRGSAITVVATMSNNTAENVRMNLFTKKRQVLH